MSKYGLTGGSHILTFKDPSRIKKSRSSTLTRLERPAEITPSIPPSTGAQSLWISTTLLSFSGFHEKQIGYLF